MHMKVTRPQSQVLVSTSGHYIQATLEHRMQPRDGRTTTNAVGRIQEAVLDRCKASSTKYGTIGASKQITGKDCRAADLCQDATPSSRQLGKTVQIDDERVRQDNINHFLIVQEIGCRSTSICSMALSHASTMTPDQRSHL
nr:hypothetical protein CFP56_26054 [Quercus suber]